VRHLEEVDHEILRTADADRAFDDHLQLTWQNHRQKVEKHMADLKQAKILRAIVRASAAAESRPDRRCSRGIGELDWFAACWRAFAGLSKVPVAATGAAQSRGHKVRLAVSQLTLIKSVLLLVQFFSEQDLPRLSGDGRGGGAPVGGQRPLWDSPGMPSCASNWTSA
jgi:hypothetical protein